ncbi:hypothetical protein [Rhodococcus qingshengii]|uniref:hypothetical protein n=1 Tax=Rhodococcus qingshengii TaxID=334542 RepID=UPI003F6CEF0A
MEQLHSRGVAPLVSGEATVLTTAVSAASRILLTAQTDICGAISQPAIASRVAGRSFVIRAKDASGTAVTNETRPIAWLLLEPVLA